MKTKRKIVSIVKIVMAVAILASLIQVVSADMPELKLPLEPGFEWGITCCYDGTGGGICAITHSISCKDRYAIDFNLPGEADNGRSIRAVASGTAEVKYDEDGYGHYVDIDHGDGYISRYAHLKATPTISGYISQGTEVGKCGNSGLAEGTHLHFVLYHKVDGQLNPVKPEPMSGYTGFEAWGGPYLSDNYGDSWNFNTPANAEGWEAHNVKDYSVEDGKYFINPKQNDPYVQSAMLSLNTDNYNAVEINMASNCPDGNARVYFVTEDLPSYDESKMVEFKVNNDGDWQTYTIYMANHNLWEGTITGIRIDPAENGEKLKKDIDKVDFDWIKIIKTDEEPEPIPIVIIYVPDDYLTIQEAVDAADEGNTIIVKEGIYCENIEIDKRLTLAGEGEVIVESASDKKYGFAIIADYVNISGFKIIGQRYYVGIILHRSDNSRIEDMEISDNKYGIRLYYSNGNIIKNSVAEENNYGVSFYCSDGNVITDNVVKNNQRGIHVYSSSENIISKNEVNNNLERGIYLRGSHGNDIIENTVSDNDEGISLYASRYCNFFYNNLLGNTQNACDSVYLDPKSFWSGNYYSDYTGVDFNNDGIGDSPYIISGGRYENNYDNYPLMEPY